MPRRPSNKELSPKARAVKLLARREHSARELAHKLRARDVGAEEADGAVAELAQAGWQSDARYAEALVRQRVMQGYGSLRIEAELEAAGIAEETIRAALDAVECDWAELAAETHARHFGAPPRGAKAWQKHYRFLAGRGFTPEQIYAVLKNGPNG